jgi:Toprim-like
MPEELTSAKGETYFLVTRAELEAAPGWKGSHGGRKGRGACIMHGGDNVTAMEADFTTGDVRCRTRSCYGRIADHPDTKAGKDSAPRARIVLGSHRPGPVKATPPTPAPKPPATPPKAADLANLRAALKGFAADLPDSPGERYLSSRGVALDLAQAYGIGWGGTGGTGIVASKMAGRVVFPLTDAEGNVTSATGRDTTGKDSPKYDTLPAATYPTTWFNGGAIAVAAAEGLPVYLTEGPLDALALLAGGITTAVSVLGTSGVRVKWLARAGVRHVVACFDDDDAGRKGRAELAFAAAAIGVTVQMMPPAVLGECNDLGEFWQRHAVLPPELLAHWDAAQLADGHCEPPATPPDDDPFPELEEQVQRDDVPELDLPTIADVTPAADFTDARARALCPAGLEAIVLHAVTIATSWRPLAFAHLSADIADAQLDERERSLWRAVLAEADARRRVEQPHAPRCRMCGAEQVPSLGHCRRCHGWARPPMVVGLEFATLQEHVADLRAVLDDLSLLGFVE